MRLIYDLDHTLIDSSHRQLTREDGSLCIDSWRKMSTREYIFSDSLLPMAEHCKRNLGRIEVIACTARVMSDHDHDFLLAHGLQFDAVLSRPEGVSLKDDALKVGLLKGYALAKGIGFTQFARQSIMFDDNKNVLSTLTRHGFRCYDAIEINQKLAKTA